MGTMLQAADLTLDDFHGPRGLQRDPQRHPPRRRARHPRRVLRGRRRRRRDQHVRLQPRQPRRVRHLRPHPRAGRGGHPARPRGRRRAGRPPRRRPRFVLGSMGPGTKLPTLGHAPFAILRDAYAGGGARPDRRRGGRDPRRDLPGPAAGQGRHHRQPSGPWTPLGPPLPIIAHVTVETTGTMLLGSEIGAALTALEPLGIDMIGLNCATGPAEMSEHLRHLSQHAPLPVSVMPNAGLPQLGPNGAEYPLTPGGARRRRCSGSSPSSASASSAAAAARPPSTSAQVADAVRGSRPARARARCPSRASSSLYQRVPFQQDAGVLMIGERTNANGSKAFREAMLAEDCAEVRRDRAGPDPRRRPHARPLRRLRRPRRRRRHARRSPAGSRRRRRCRSCSTPPRPTVAAGRPRAPRRPVRGQLGQLRGRRRARTRGSSKIMPLVTEHGAAVVALTIDEEGQARTAEWKVRVAERLHRRPHRRTGACGSATSSSTA